MWDKKMKGVKLIELAHDLTSRARPSSSSPRLQTEPSWLVYNRANFELFRASCEPRVF
ncbi:hypothetical protein HanRHA438_Chr01g0024101 [Helianthus annuus]|nr:hypothetical protein HanRHA438_Chr01g0024101 [Helianthus annuus]